MQHLKGKWPVKPMQHHSYGRARELTLVRASVIAFERRRLSRVTFSGAEGAERQ